MCVWITVDKDWLPGDFPSGSSDDGEDENVFGDGGASIGDDDDDDDEQDLLASVESSLIDLHAELDRLEGSRHHASA